MGQILALAVMVAVLSFWRKTSYFGKFSYVANLGLILAGIYLLFAQLHGYQHDVNGESFRFPTEEHRHVHEDLDIQNTTDNSRNAL